MATRFEPNPVTIRALPLKLARAEVNKACRLVESGAKLRIQVDTGVTRNQMYRKVFIRGGRVIGEVGNRARIGMVLHEGAAPHRIPTTGYTRMTFFWRKVGRLVTFYAVNHPGMEGSFYLTRTLMERMVPLGYRVTIFPQRPV